MRISGCRWYLSDRKLQKIGRAKARGIDESSFQDTSTAQSILSISSRDPGVARWECHGCCRGGALRELHRDCSAASISRSPPPYCYVLDFIDAFSYDIEGDF